jgi:hypothetical protein
MGLAAGAAASKGPHSAADRKNRLTNAGFEGALDPAGVRFLIIVLSY